MKKSLLITVLILSAPLVADAARQSVTQITGTQSSIGALKTQINTRLDATDDNFGELYDGKSDKTAVVRYWPDWPTVGPNNVLAINTIVAFDGKLYKATQQVTKTSGTPDPATLTTHFAEVGAGDNLGSATASDIAALFSGSGDCLKSDGTKGSCGTGGGYTNLTQFLTQTNWRVFYSDGSGDVKELALGADGEYLKSNGAGAAPSWATPTGGAHDAVTLGADADVIFGLSTQQLTLDSQSANTFFAAPNGGAGDPTFRAIADADIPSAIARDSELPTDATITTTDVTTNNAGTTKHGWLLKATAPSSGLRNIVAIDNGETAYKNAALFDATNPSTQAFGDSAAVGSAMVAARRDHKHAMPPAPTTITGNAGTATALAANGTNCSAGQAALGVDASGNAEGCWTPSGSMTYPGSGIPQSTGSAWGTSITPGTGVVAALGNAVDTAGGLASYSGIRAVVLGTGLTKDTDTPSAGTDTFRVTYPVTSEAWSGSGWNADTDGLQRNDAYDYLHIADPDDDGKPSVLDMGAGMVKTDSSGNVSAASVGTDYTTPSSTESPTNKTFDANGTGNTLKGYGYITFTKPHNRGSATGAVGTIETSILYGVPSFADDVETNNYVDYIGEVPRDLDTAVDLVAYFKFRLGGADTGDHSYKISMIDVADSGTAAGTPGDSITLAYTADSSGADGDVETATGTLTDWKTNATAGSFWLIRVTRDGDDATNDTSTVDSYPLELTIRYGFSQ